MNNESDILDRFVMKNLSLNATCTSSEILILFCSKKLNIFPIWPISGPKETPFEFSISSTNFEYTKLLSIVLLMLCLESETI